MLTKNNILLIIVLFLNVLALAQLPRQKVMLEMGTGTW